MKLNYSYAIPVFAAFICGSCSISEKFTTFSHLQNETISESVIINSVEFTPTEYQPSSVTTDETNSPPTNEIEYFGSIENFSENKEESDQSYHVDHQPSTSLKVHDMETFSEETIYFEAIASAENELYVSNPAFILPCNAIIYPDTVPQKIANIESELARSSKNFGIWSLVGLLIIPYIAIIFGIIAISKGSRAKRMFAREPNTYYNERDADAGIVMGSISVGLFVLVLLGLLIYFLSVAGLINLPNW